jgi:putative hemolysin
MEYEIGFGVLVTGGLFFLALVESAHGAMSDVALRSLAERQASRRGAFLRHLLQHRLKFWLSLSLGIQGATILLTAVSVLIALHFANRAILIGALAATFLVVVPFRQILPRLIVQNAPEKFLLTLLPAFEIYFNLTRLLVGPMYRAIRFFRKESEGSITPESATPTDDETIQALIDVGEEAGIFEEDEGELIQSVIEFSDTVVREIMTQRTDIVSVEAGMTVRQACEVMMRERHSRLPVFQTDSDDIVGVVYIRDLLARLVGGHGDTPIRPLARTAYFVPENKSIADLLEDMRKSKVQIAMVIDEYGDIAGVVTIEDILEEIVGEIEDEDVSDPGPDEIEIVPEDDRTFLVRGSTEIRKVETLVNLELESDDFQTVNGFITGKLERVPEVGESFTLHGLAIEVLESDGRALRRVRLRMPPSKVSESGVSESGVKE